MVDEDIVEREHIKADACGRWDRRTAARALGRSPTTLSNWAVKGFGPRSFLVGGQAYYWPHEVIAFGRGELRAA